MRLAGLMALGMVWGWWTVPWLELRPRLRAAALVLSAVVLQGFQIAWLLNVQAVRWLLAGWVAGLFVNVVFRAAARAHARERLNS